jgi:DNA-binding MarR family transcriptional regulator
MHTSSQSPTSLEAGQLLRRMIHLRSHFRLAAPENISALKKQIRETSLSDKSGEINGALLYLAGTIFTHYTGPISMGEFSRDLDVPLSTATRTMDWLVKKGYVQRLSDPNDRRIVRVELTGTGKEIYQVINTYILERVEKALSQLTPPERNTFVELANRVLDGFEAAA